MGMSKEYRKYFSDGKLMQVAKITLTRIGKFGFETSLFGIEPYVLNMNMPMFDTEQKAEEWILSTGKWKQNNTDGGNNNGN